MRRLRLSIRTPISVTGSNGSVGKYRCELHDTDGTSVFIDVDASDWPLMPDIIVYGGRMFVLKDDHYYHEARVFFHSAEAR
jgi:hypothetical protein